MTYDKEDERRLRGIGGFMQVAGQSIAVAFMEKRVDNADFHGVVMPLRNAYQHLQLFLHRHELNHFGEIDAGNPDIYGLDKTTMEEHLATARAEERERCAVECDKKAAEMRELYFVTGKREYQDLADSAAGLAALIRAMTPALEAE